MALVRANFAPVLVLGGAFSLLRLFMCSLNYHLFSLLKPMTLSEKLTMPFSLLPRHNQFISIHYIIYFWQNVGLYLFKYLCCSIYFSIENYKYRCTVFNMTSSKIEQILKNTAVMFHQIKMLRLAFVNYHLLK